jgi:hypothetical protein
MDVIVHCSTIDKFQKILEENNSSRLTVACTNDKFIEGASLLLDNRNVDSPFKWIQIKNEKQLMQHLCVKAMLSYFNQGKEHQKNGDCGLANLCFCEAQKALNQKTLIF